MEPRAYHSGAAGLPPPLPNPGSVGYPRAATPTLAATLPGPHWFFMTGEELRNVLIKGRIAPSTRDNAQMLKAILNLRQGV